MIRTYLTMWHYVIIGNFIIKGFFYGVIKFAPIFRLKDFAPALKHIADIIERGIREHPELSVGMQTEGIEVVLDQE